MNIGFHKDYQTNKMMELENRLAKLEGKPEPHKKVCLTCNDTGSIYCWAGHQDWYEPCNCPRGKKNG